jgi:hypothetical protein
MRPMSPDPLNPPVQTCFRCGHLAELPAAGSGVVGGLEQDHVPLCTDCLQLLTTDSEAFWKPLRRRPG